MTDLVWLDLPARPGAEQMALDHALLDLAAREGVTILRCYRWSRDTISFGANEAASRTWDRARIEGLGLPCVRRPTGGRAVWHAAADLTYSLATPLGGVGELRLAYRTIHERIAGALATLGLETALAPPPSRLPGLRPGACFDAAVGGEILVGGRKAVGSAQVARGGAMLQHGAIARADRLRALHEVGRAPLPAPDGAAVATDLPTPEILADAIAAAWHRAGAVTIGSAVAGRAELMSRDHLDHYRDTAWTWRR